MRYHSQKTEPVKLGIGRAFAYALGEAGAEMAVVDLVSESAETVAYELSEKGIAALAVTADVTQPDQIQKMVDTIVSHWGRLPLG